MERLPCEAIRDSGAESLVAEHFNRYRFCARFIAGKHVLDAGCGNGFGASLMAEAGARQVDAIDIDPEAITLARQRYARPEVGFAVGDLLSLTAGERYDVVVSFETIEHIADTERFLQVLRDALKPGGLLFLSTPNRRVWNPRATRFDQPRNPFHRFELTRDELARLLSGHFRVEEIYGQHPYYYRGTRIRTTASILASSYLRRMLHLRRADYWKLSQVRPIRSYHESAYLVARCSKPGGL